MPTSALPRSTRAQPAMRSLRIGLRLCGMAEEPFWPFAEGLLGLAHLGALQVAYLGGELLDAGADERQRAEEAAWRSRCTTWLRDRLGREAELGADQLLDARVDVGVGADGAADLADGDVVGGGAQPFAGGAPPRTPTGRASCRR